MIRFLECPDLHFDPQGLELFNIWSEAIKKQAKEQAVDYVAIPGDIYKSVITNDNKGGVNLLAQWIEELTAICPVVGIEGTPSHDAPGSYGILERAGLILLKPGKVYGLVQERIIDITNLPRFLGDSILFGVPELNKNNIHAHLNLSAEEANATAVQLFEDYMDEFVAPMRLKYKNLPAHMLFHGNVSDTAKDNTSDIIMKSSEIVINSHVFARANLTRVSLGHIHKPWESGICNMGYNGSPGLSFGERDFIPAMTMVTSDGEKTRLPYGTPMRKKVLKASSIKPDPNIAYWLVSENEELPNGIHAWSRVTKPTNMKKATRRATEEQVEKISSLWDLAILLDSTLDERLKPKFEELQAKNKKEVLEKINIDVDSVEIIGCKFFSGDRAYLDISGLNSGLTAVGGEVNGMANGIGKSSILAFCSPFPNVVGKDTKSGRTSALKDFFFMSDSRIVKKLTVNGQKHEHIITIKAPHTKTGGKVECYLNIDGVPQLDKGTFDEMFAMCESLYGSYQDYLLTSFYVQPLQGKTGSSLMSANMTTIRDLVQGIAGIDRSQEKDYANAKKLEIEQALNGIDIKIKYAEENLQPKEPILEEIEVIQEKISSLVAEINEGNAKGKALKAEIDELIVKQKANDNLKTVKSEKESQLEIVNADILSIPGQIHFAEKSLATIEEDKETLKKHEADKIVVDKYNRDLKDYGYYTDLEQDRIGLVERLDSIVIDSPQEIENKIEALLEWKREASLIEQENRDLETNYSKELQEYTVAKNEFDSLLNRKDHYISRMDSSIKNSQELIKAKSVSCPECGYISPEAKKEIEEIESDIDRFIIERDGYINDKENLSFTLKEPVKKDPKPLPPAPFSDDLYTLKSDLSNIEIFTKLKADIKKDIQAIEKKIEGLEIKTEPVDPGITLQPDFIIDDIKRRVENSVNTRVEINTLKNQLESAEKRKTELGGDIASIVIDWELDGKLEAKQSEIDSLRGVMTAKQSEGAGLQESLKNLNIKLESIDAEAQKIQDMKNGIAKQIQDKDDWTEIAMLLGSNKIPALELDLKLDAIDAEATKILAPYQEGQYSFNSSTQQEGKKQAVDKFDIKIHDSITGIEKSFVEFSPGVKAVFSDAMGKALLRFRNTNSYNPTIKDEADGAVAPKHIAEYYMIQENYFRQDPNTKVLIVSQCTEAKAYIENFKDIKEIRGLLT